MPTWVDRNIPAISEIGKGTLEELAERERIRQARVKERAARQFGAGTARYREYLRHCGIDPGK